MRIGGVVVPQRDGADARYRRDDNGSRRGRPRHLHRLLYNAVIIAAGDLFSLAVAVLVALALTASPSGVPAFSGWLPILLAAWGCGTLLLRLTPGWGLGSVEELRRISLLLTVIFAGVAVALSLQGSSDRAGIDTLILAFVLAFVMLPVTRAVVRKLLLLQGRWGVATVVYGGGPLGARIVQILSEQPGLGYQVIGVLDDEAEWRTYLGAVPVLGGTEWITKEASVAILAMPGISAERMPEILAGPLSSYRRVLIVPDVPGIHALPVSPRDLDGDLGLEISSYLSRPLARALKHTAEVALILLTAILWVPLCVTIALCIWAQDGDSPFFVQERVGRYGGNFRAFKFRSMVVNADEVLRQSLAADPSLRAEWEMSFKLKRDPRVTAFGAFLRRTSLDELPQLINVLRGEMSLVGPRAITRYHYEELSVQVRMLRDRVRPGLTGMWQVSGRCAIGTQGMERWDAYYVRNGSMWLDIVILARTFRAVVEGTGAY